MPVIRLEGAADPRVAEFSTIAEPELVRQRGCFVAEGRHIVQRLIEDGRYRVRSVLVSEAARQELVTVLDRLETSVPIYVCPLQSFRDITGFNLHRGCLALAERLPATSAAALLARGRLVILLESIANPDNVGGIFRNAAAFGADAVLLDAASCDPLYRKAIRTSMGATLRVPFARLDWPQAIADVREMGFTIVALTAREPAEPLDRFAAGHRADRLLLLLGNEGDGLSEPARAAADHCVRIPISSEVDSLNVAVAAGIALAQLTRFAQV